jgi:serine/threonine-protein kinase HipA
MVEARAQIKTNQSFDLLAVIGKDCVGAIQIVEGEIPVFKKQILSKPLTETQIASLLRNYRQYPLGMSDAQMV